MTLNGRPSLLFASIPRRPPWAIWPSRNAGTTRSPPDLKSLVSLASTMRVSSPLLRGGSVRGHRRLTGGADG